MPIDAFALYPPGSGTGSLSAPGTVRQQPDEP